jgi:hypothetical protein
MKFTTFPRSPLLYLLRHSIKILSDPCFISIKSLLPLQPYYLAKSEEFHKRKPRQSYLSLCLGRLGFFSCFSGLVVTEYGFGLGIKLGVGYRSIPL